jgi:hypothetical protein
MCPCLHGDFHLARRFLRGASFRVGWSHTGRRGGRVLFPGAEPGVDVGGSEAPAGVEADGAGELACVGTAVDPGPAATQRGRQLVGGHEVVGWLRLHEYKVTWAVTSGNGREIGTRAVRCLFLSTVRVLDLGPWCRVRRCGGLGDHDGRSG